MTTTHRRIGATLGAAIILALSAVADVRADSWTGRDKQMHLAAGAAVALPVTLATGSTWRGLAAGCGVGVAKELADMRRAGHVASYRDAGAQIGGLIVVPRRDGVAVAYSVVF